MPEILDTPALKERARQLRLDILEMTTKAGSGHVSSSYSAVEIVTALYFGGILRYNANQPGDPNRVYVLLGDGECQAGQVWEAAMAAAHFKTDRLIAILDYNKYQEMGPISREMALEPLTHKWASFGWHVAEVNGHDIEAVIRQLTALQAVKEQPAILIAHTIKGKGVSFVEADYTFHGRALKGEQVDLAREELNHVLG